MANNNLDLFVNQLKLRVNNNVQFIATNSDVFCRCAWQNVFQATQILMKCIRLIDNKGSDKENYTNLLLINCLSDILDSLLSTLSGFTRGPGIILRGVVENMAIVIVVQNDDKKFSLYVDNKLSNTSQITPAKKYLPSIGDIYGLLTNTYVHEKFELSARCLSFVDSDDVEFSLLPKATKEDLHRNNLFLISNIARYVGSLVEYCNLSKITDFYYWQLIDGVLKENKNTYEDNLIQELTKILS